MGHDVVAAQPQRLPVGGHGVGRATERLIGLAQPRVIRRLRAVDAQGAHQKLSRDRGLADLQGNRRQQIDRLVVVRMGRQKLAIGPLGLGQSAGPLLLEAGDQNGIDRGHRRPLEFRVSSKRGERVSRPYRFQSPRAHQVCHIWR